MLTGTKRGDNLSSKFICCTWCAFDIVARYPRVVLIAFRKRHVWNVRQSRQAVAFHVCLHPMLRLHAICVTTTVSNMLLLRTLVWTACAGTLFSTPGTRQQLQQSW
jgi:hypothetical protein